MITAHTVRIIDYCVLSASGVCIAFCLAAAAYAVPWTHRMQSGRASRQFNRLWKARVAMEAVAALWLVWAVLRMLALWGVRSRPGLASNRTSEQLCRIYLAFSLGCFQPLLLLLTLLLCQTTLSSKRRRERDALNAWALLGWAAAGTAPVVAVQVVLAWFSAIGDRGWESRMGSVQRYFFGVYYRGSAAQCVSDAPGCTTCVYPAAMVIVTGIFCVLFAVALRIIFSRMAATTINRRIIRRMRLLEIGTDLLLAANLAFAGASISTNPFSLVWQLLWIGYSASNILLAALLTWLLVLVPVYVAKSADQFAELMSLEDEEDYSDVETPHASGSGQAPLEMALLVKPSASGRKLTSDARTSSSASSANEQPNGHPGGSNGGAASTMDGSMHGGSHRSLTMVDGAGSRRSLLEPYHASLQK